MKSIPLVVHLIYKLDFGGLETLLVECVNHMPAEKYRHAIVCLTDFTEFSKKITRPDVAIYSLNKPPGLGLKTHIDIWKLFRKIKPTILHTYNLSAIEYTLAAALAGVPIRVHAEHGRDTSDPEGTNWKHNLLRRLLIPFIDFFIPVSVDLKNWLKSAIHVPDEKILLINNGVDTHRFNKMADNAPLEKSVHFSNDCLVIGTVGRVQDVKNHHCLIAAFMRLQELLPLHKARLRLAIVGNGPLFSEIQAKTIELGISDVVWMPGARDDIADIMQNFSVFAMTSIAEGTPVVILEAMASGLPVVATKVGGIPELVIDGVTGSLVAPSDPVAFAEALAPYLTDPTLQKRHGMAGRERIEKIYSIEAMLGSYTNMYDGLCQSKSLN
jgi:sugar transferase (PEP-CTERM/EpsH1 system associated)